MANVPMCDGNDDLMTNDDIDDDDVLLDDGQMT